MPLSVKDGMGAWVDDFKKSDAPQFKGKSEKERREMAIAAYMSAKKESVNEAKRTVTIDTPDRLTSMRVSKDKPPFTPDPPKPKAKNSDGSTTSPMSRARQLARQARDRSKEKDEGYVSHAQRKAVWANRADDGKGHPDKKKNESVEENYNWKVSHGGKDVHVKAPHAGAAVKKAQKGFGNMDLTKAKVSNLGKVGAPTTEATVDTANIASKKAMKKSDTEKLGKLADMLAKEKKPQKESVELEEMKANAAYTKAAKDIKAYAGKSGGIDKKDMMNFAADLDLMGRAPNILQAGRILDRINTRFKGYDTDVRDRLSMYLKKHGLMEGTQLDELSPATHKSYQAKAFTSGARGMAAKRMGTMSAKDAYDNEKKRHAGIELSKSLQRRDDRKKRNEEVEEATYGTQAQRMMSPLQKIRQDKEKADRDRDGKLKSTALPMRKKNEETVSELKKSTLGSYVKKASQDAAAKAYRSAMDANAPAYNPDQRDRSGINYMKSVKRQKGIARATDKLTKEDTNEAKSFDQKFKDHLKFATSKSPAVQAYMKKRRDDRDARHAKQDPAAVKKNYGPAVIPPGTAYNKASKKGMNPSQAANAVSTAFKNRAKKGGKLPK